MAKIEFTPEEQEVIALGLRNLFDEERDSVDADRSRLITTAMAKFAWLTMSSQMFSKANEMQMDFELDYPQEMLPVIDESKNAPKEFQYR